MALCLRLLVLLMLQATGVVVVASDAVAAVVNDNRTIAEVLGGVCNPGNFSWECNLLSLAAKTVSFD